jgi:hypothetical protein
MHDTKTPSAGPTVRESTPRSGVTQLLKHRLAVKTVSVHASPGPKAGVSDSADEPTGVARELDQSGFGPGAMAAIGSVALALYYYYVRGQKQRGQFVGLWPATILGLAAYLKLEELKRILQETDT